MTRYGTAASQHVTPRALRLGPSRPLWHAVQGATPIACAEQVAWDVCWLLDDAGIIDAKAVCGGASFTTAAARCAEGGTAACVSAATSVVLKAMGC